MAVHMNVNNTYPAESFTLKAVPAGTLTSEEKYVDTGKFDVYEIEDLGIKPDFVLNDNYLNEVNRISLDAFSQQTNVRLDGSEDDYEIHEYFGGQTCGGGVWRGSTMYSIFDKRTGKTTELTLGKTLCVGIPNEKGGYSESALKELEIANFDKPGESVTLDNENPKKSIVKLVAESFRLKSMNGLALNSMQISYTVKTESPDKWLDLLRKAVSAQKIGVSTS